MVRINRRTITDIKGKTFAVYGLEEKDKFGNWKEITNFTSKKEFSNYWKFFRRMGEMEKIGDWETRPEL